jgi:regulation of enolase protein 1 (concanavalin A-like superfamily)
METIAWTDMTWLNEPPSVELHGSELVVNTGPETDFWRSTAYGFVHDDGHFLSAPFPAEGALEVSFRAHLAAQFDQAGLMLRAGPETWLKAGVELSDGQRYASVVVTNGRSDWSVAPLPPLPPMAEDTTLTVRASRQGDGVTVRYRLGKEAAWQLLRVAYLPPEAELRAGPMTCSPTRAGLTVRFAPVRFGPPDEALHEA